MAGVLLHGQAASVAGLSLWLLPHHMTAHSFVTWCYLLMTVLTVRFTHCHGKLPFLQPNSSYSYSVYFWHYYSADIGIYIIWHTVRSENNANRIFGTAVQRRHNVNVLNVGLCRMQTGCTWMSLNVNCDTHGWVHGRGRGRYLGLLSVLSCRWLATYFHVFLFVHASLCLFCCLPDRKWMFGIVGYTLFC